MNVLKAVKFKINFPDEYRTIKESKDLKCIKTPVVSESEGTNHKETNNTPTLSSWNLLSIIRVIRSFES
jgi:hypothetical protein